MRQPRVFAVSLASALSLQLLTSVLGHDGTVFAGDQPVIIGGSVFYPPINVPGTSSGSEPSDPATTDFIVRAISEAALFCGAINQKEYVIDCLAYEYSEIQNQLPGTGEYSEAKRAIRQAAVKLNSLARAERSSTKRPAIVSRGGTTPHRTKRPLVPVTTESLPAVSEAAAQIIQETQTILLRSVANSERRRRQNQRIAEAMETGTILLRS